MGQRRRNKRGKVHLTNHGLRIGKAQANAGVESRVALTDVSTVLRNPEDVIGAFKQTAVANSNPSVASEQVAGDVLTIQRAHDDVFGILRRGDVANDDVKSIQRILRCLDRLDRLDRLDLLDLLDLFGSLRDRCAFRDDALRDDAFRDVFRDAFGILVRCAIASLIFF